MGYCYDARGRLCCDACDVSGGVRKRRCPFGWCPPLALCDGCASSQRAILTRAYHRKMGCEQAHLDWLARDRREGELLAQGEAVRCSALGVGEGLVHVLFRRANGSTVGRYMPSATYRAVRLCEPATPADFAAIGPIEGAPSTFAGGNTTKRVA